MAKLERGTDWLELIERVGEALARDGVAEGGAIALRADRRVRIERVGEAPARARIAHPIFQGLSDHG